MKMSNQRFLLMDSSLRNLTFKLESITLSSFDEDWHSTLHTHPFTELFYVTEGEGFFVTNTSKISVRENDLIIVNPHIEHTEASSDNKPLKYIVAGIQGLSFSKPTKEIHDEVETFFSISSFHDENKDLLNYLNTILTEIDNEQPGYEMICHAMLEALIIKLLRQQTFELDTAPKNKLTKDVTLMKQYMQNHYHQRITLDHLAQVTHLNRYYISHTFKNKVGMSPMEFLNSIRIKESKILLETTNYSITQIATIVGFSNQSYFSETFKQKIGVSPSNYRKERQEA